MAINKLQTTKPATGTWLNPSNSQSTSSTGDLYTRVGLKTPSNDSVSSYFPRKKSGSPALSTGPARDTSIWTGAAGGPKPAPTTPPATTPPASTTPTSTTPVASPYFARGTSTDNTYNTAKDILAPTAPKSPDDFYTQLFNQSRGIIDAINQDYQTKVNAAKIASEKSSKRVNAVAANAGMAGSPDAYKGEADVAITEDQAIAEASATRAKDTETLLSSLTTEAYNRSQTDKTNQETKATNYIAAQETRAKETVKNLASKGSSLEDIKTSNPDAYSTLLSHYNGDETALNADYLANVPTASILNGDKPIGTLGSKAVYAIQDPITKKITTMEVDTGVPLNDSKDTEVIRVPNKGIFVYNKKTQQGSLISGESASSNAKPKTSGSLQYTNDEVSSLGTLMRTGGDVGGSSYAPADENGFVDPALYEEMYNNWVDSGGLPQDYARLYPPKIYINPSDNSNLPSFLQNREKAPADSTDFTSVFGQ